MQVPVTLPLPLSLTVVPVWMISFIETIRNHFVITFQKSEMLCNLLQKSLFDKILIFIKILNLKLVYNKYFAKCFTNIIYNETNKTQEHSTVPLNSLTEINIKLHYFPCSLISILKQPEVNLRSHSHPFQLITHWDAGIVFK